MTTVFGLFAKPPVLGTVKTRLAADVGDEAASDLYTAFVADLLNLHEATGDVRVLGFGGRNLATSEAWARSVAGDPYQVWAQPDGNLGLRMHAFFEHALALGDRAVLIGTDSPNLPLAYVEQAFAALEKHDVVLGPASDGGYYLVGQRGSAQDIFGSIEWSSARVFEQTAVTVRRNQAALAVLPVWYDVDTLDDARMLWAHLQAVPSAERARLPQTCRQLALIFGAGG